MPGGKQTIRPALAARFLLPLLFFEADRSAFPAAIVIPIVSKIPSKSMIPFSTRSYL
jgi:hypothetical protein